MKLLFFLFILSFVVLASCATQTSKEDTATECPPTCSGGSKGVTSTILYPKEDGVVYAQEQFSPALLLQDTGEANGEGIVCITGLDPETFGGVGGCACQDFSVVLDDPKDPNFKETTVIFPASSITTETGGQQTMTAITRTLYTTYGIINLCLTGDPYTEKTCSVEGNKVAQSSSGPVEVTKVTEQLTPLGSNAVTLRLSVEMTVHANDNEQLVEKEETSNPSCVLSSDDENFGTYADMALVLFGERYDCGRVRFEEGKTTARGTCRVEAIPTERFIGEQKQYNGYVEVTYGFQNIQSQQFSVAVG